VSGCAPGIGVYDRAGGDYAQWRRDDAECRRAKGDEGSGAIEGNAYGRCMRARGYHLRPE
jgi:hypothetical protein